VAEVAKQIIVPILVSAAARAPDIHRCRCPVATGAPSSPAFGDRDHRRHPPLPTISIGSIEVSDAVAGRDPDAHTSGALFACRQ